MKTIIETKHAFLIIVEFEIGLRAFQALFGFNTLNCEKITAIHDKTVIQKIHFSLFP